MGGGVGRGAAGLEVTDNTRHRPVLGKLHNRRQRHPLTAGSGHEPGPETMPAEIPLQSGEPRPPLHDFADSGWGQGRADALFPQPPEDSPLGEA